MMSAPLPTLDGWITDPNQRAERMLGYFLTANPYASSVLYDDIYSLQDLVSKYQDNPTQLAEEVSAALRRQFSRVWQDSRATVRSLDSDTKGDSRYTLKITLEFRENNKSYQLSSAIAVNNGIINKINAIETLNTGY